MLLTGFAVLAAFGLTLYGYMKFTGPGPLAEDKVFQIKRGIGLLGIAADLEKAGVISSANTFAVAAKANGSAGRLKPGEYQFRQAISMQDVMALIVSGNIIRYKVAIPEGWTTAQALDRVRENDVLSGDISVTPGEGQIMPDTYLVQRGDTRDDVIKHMVASSQKLMDELWPQRADDTPVKTPEQALILASIIEKETGVPQERPRVAAVFANRLRHGMRLQSDPTIIYGITGGKAKLDRPLTRKDLAEATPYNTYHIDGLPPGPIANPGRASIEAALAPARTNDLYFVADGSGGHVFAATLPEHRANVRKWREIEKQHNQNGEEVPVMDEDGASSSGDEPAQQQAKAPAQQQAETAPQSAEPAPQPAQPAPQAQEGNQQQGQDSGLPSLNSIDAGGQNADGSTTPPEAESADAAGQPQQGDTPAQAAVIPSPRPKPEGMKTTAAASESPQTAVADVTLDLKPGSVIKGAKGLIPIPAPKPPLP
jgi:UPF0755 protein